MLLGDFDLLGTAERKPDINRPTIGPEILGTVAMMMLDTAVTSIEVIY